eukprot:jgi/Antlo1/2121/2235
MHSPTTHMEKLEEELRLKYGRGLVPKEEIQEKLDLLSSQGYICAEDVKYVIPMIVDDFVAYVSDLRRNFLYADYEFKDFDSFREPFHSFVDDLREKTQLILSEAKKRGPVADKSDLRARKSEILVEVVRSYLQYERRKKGRSSLLFLLPLAFLALLLLTYTPKPF